MHYSGTDPESYITEYTLVYEDLLTHSGSGLLTHTAWLLLLLLHYSQT